MNADEVERALTSAGLVVQDRKPLNNGKDQQLTFKSGEIVCVYGGGKIVPQGKNQPKVREVLALGQDNQTKHSPASKKVFVAHGHDAKARDQLDATLRRWGYEPIIL